MTTPEATSAAELEARARRRDESVGWKVFIGVGLFIAVIALVYWFASYERAGTTMLALSSALALFFGSFLFVQERRREGTRPVASAEPVEDPAGTEVLQGELVAEVADAPDGADEGHYLPTASAWPFAMGIGAAMAVNGLIISWPYATPGLALLALGVVGFVAQGRRRG